MKSKLRRIYIEQFGIELDLVVETQISLNEFTNQFTKWVESNGWSFGGRMRVVNENGDTIKDKEENMVLLID